MNEECAACGMMTGGTEYFCAECGLTFCANCMVDGVQCVNCASDDNLGYDDSEEDKKFNCEFYKKDR